MSPREWRSVRVLVRGRRQIRDPRTLPVGPTRSGLADGFKPHQVVVPPPALLTRHGLLALHWMTCGLFLLRAPPVNGSVASPGGRRGSTEKKVLTKGQFDGGRSLRQEQLTVPPCPLPHDVSLVTPSQFTRFPHMPFRVEM